MRFLAVLFAALVLCTGAASAQQCGPRDAELSLAQTHPNYQSHMLLDPDQATRALAVLGVEPLPDLKHGLWVVRQDAVSIVVIWRTDGTCGYIMAPPTVGPAILKAVRGTGA